jgi:hypothetical protein
VRCGIEGAREVRRLGPRLVVWYTRGRSKSTRLDVIPRALRRLRFGRPIIVVSGLPRSGTSMAMSMLAAGGVPILTDGARPADGNNPRGYFELERVKELDKTADAPWLRDARGKAVKIISLLLTYLPETNDYRVVFMHRDLDEIIASQNRMLAAGAAGSPEAGDDERLKGAYRHHLDQIARFIGTRSCFQVLSVEYSDVLAHPAREARRMRDFLGLPLDVDRMAAAVDPHLYRSKRRSRRRDPSAESF